MQRLGRYEIQQELGRGGMGVVYRGIDPAIGRIIAIKTIRLSDRSVPEGTKILRERFLREAKAAGSLSHPNVVAVHDIGQEGDTDFIVMEFVQGRDLEQMLKEKVPEGEESLRILMDSATALDYAHQHGIIHRDVKPANIMVRNDGTVKLSDFGIAQIMGEQTISGTGAVLGSPYYLPPEQLNAQKVDGRGDQFSLAAIAYQMLTGQKPFDADSLPAILAKILFHDPAPPQAINPALGAGVEHALRKAMSKDPKERFGSCTEFVGALTAAFRASGAATAENEESGGVQLPLDTEGTAEPPMPMHLASFLQSRWFPPLVMAVIVSALAGAVWFSVVWQRNAAYEAYYWQSIKDSAYVELFQSYLQEVPNGKHADDARAKIRLLEQEQKAWDQIKDSKDASAYAAFLAKFPNGRFALEARSKLQWLNMLPK